jgi:hypothetical protein
VKKICTAVAAAFETGVTTKTTFLRSIKNVPGDQLWTDYDKISAQRDRACPLVRFCLDVGPCIMKTSSV